jgi:small-conductance mechanosensitive channel
VNAPHLIPPTRRKTLMNSIIYIVGLVVVVLFVLSFFGLR